MPQGTIKTYDESSRSGVIMDDQKNELAFDAESFGRSGVRMFRLGQRVKYQIVGQGERARVRDLTIVTL
jgi:2-phospho-L-lactate guanylyltransferase